MQNQKMRPLKTRLEQNQLLMVPEGKLIIYLLHLVKVHLKSYFTTEHLINYSLFLNA
jgi:hypothetical protein